MFSFRRSFLTLTFDASAFLASQSPALLAQASSSSQQADPAPAPQSAPPAAQAPSQGQLSVAARIKARREARRAAAVKDVYSHLYEVYIGAGYLRFFPGPSLQRNNEYSWNFGVSRYYNERLGVTLDFRGYQASAFVGPNGPSNSAVYDPIISQYAGMIGPTYRFLLNPKYSVSGRVLAGFGYGNFSGDTGHFQVSGPGGLGLYPDGGSPAVSVSVPLEYNISPGLGFRLAPEYLMTRFGSMIENNRGFTTGIVVRWGKQ
jgi:hypothetical protein